MPMSLIGFGAFTPAGVTFPAATSVASDADLSNWTESGFVTKSGTQSDNYGGVEATLLTHSTNGNLSYGEAFIYSQVNGGFSADIGTTYTVSCLAKQSGTTGRWFWISLYFTTGAFIVGHSYDLQSGATGSARSDWSGVESSPTITSLGSGWYDCRFSFTGASGSPDATGCQVGFSPADAPSGNFGSAVGVSTVIGEGGYVHRFQILT